MPPRYLAELVLLAALWGASFMFMRIATPEFGAIALIQLRVSLASLVLLPIWFIRERQNLSNINEHWKPLAVVGVLNSGIPFVLFAFSTLYITGGFSAILNSTAPIWGALIGFLWIKNRVSRSAVVGLSLGVLGVLVLVSGSLTQPSGSVVWTLLAITAGTAAAFLYGIAANYTGVYLKGVSSLGIATYSLVAASIFLIPFTLAALPDGPISTQAWLAVIAMGVLSTAFANILYFDLLENVGSSKALTVTFLIPVFASIWGAVFIDEQITGFMLIGGAIILLGLALVTGVVRLSTILGKSD